MGINKKIAIAGNGSLSNGNKIIEYLESLGGRNSENLAGNSNNLSYYIDSNNIIKSFRNGNESKDYKVLKTVPEIKIKAGI